MEPLDPDAAAAAQLKLAAGLDTPISELSPDLTSHWTRVVRGVVTITWPYSSATGSIAFLLADHDFRLRRVKGQVRVQFTGSSAKAVAELGLGGGDELVLSLEGVEWAATDLPGRVPGTSLEWQITFRERLLLQAKVGESQESKTINIDNPPLTDPPVEKAAPSLASVLGPEEPLVSTPNRVLPAKRTFDATGDNFEYASPAFIKRAKVSYGSLFEDGLDIFAEHDASRRNGKRRTRFSTSWRYASQSPSPESEDADAEDAEPAPAPVPPQMVDESSQTVDVEMTPITNAPEFPATPNPKTVIFGSRPPAETSILVTSTGVGTQASFSPIPDLAAYPPTFPNPLSASTDIQSETFLPSPFAQPTAPNPFLTAESEIPRMDRVDDEGQASQYGDPAASELPDHDLNIESDLRNAEPYPSSYLDAHINTAESLQQLASHGVVEGSGTPIYPHVGYGHQEAYPEFGLPVSSTATDIPWAVTSSVTYPPLPAVEAFSTTVEQRSTQSGEAVSSPMEVNLQQTESSSPRERIEESDESEGEEVEPIEDGDGDVDDAAEEEAEEEEEIEDEDAEFEEDEIHEEARYKEDESGDYDTRQYADVQDDEEDVDMDQRDLSEEERQIFDDPDSESADSDEESDEGYDDEDEEDEEDDAQPAPAPPVAQTPVVIDLISDSEDEDDNAGVVNEDEDAEEESGDEDPDNEEDYEDEEEPEDERDEEEPSKLAVSSSPVLEPLDQELDDEMDIDQDLSVLPRQTVGVHPEDEPRMSGGLPVDDELPLNNPMNLGHDGLRGASPHQLIDQMPSEAVADIGTVEGVMATHLAELAAETTTKGAAETVRADSPFYGPSDDGDEMSASEVDSAAVWPDAVSGRRRGSSARHHHRRTSIEMLEIDVQPEDKDPKVLEIEAALAKNLEAELARAESEQAEPAIEEAEPAPEPVEPALEQAPEQEDAVLEEETLASPPQTQSIQGQPIDVVMGDTNMHQPLGETQLPTPLETQIAEEDVHDKTEDISVTPSLPLGQQPTAASSALVVVDGTNEDTPSQQNPTVGIVESTTSSTPLQLTEPGTAPTPFVLQEKIDGLSDVALTTSPTKVTPDQSETPSSQGQLELSGVVIPATTRKRGHRRNRSSISLEVAESPAQDPSVQLARASIASRRSTRRSDQTSTMPEPLRETRRGSRNFQRSDSPDAVDSSVQLAKAALKSPGSSQEHVRASRAAPKTPQPVPESQRTTRRQAQLAQQSEASDPVEVASPPQSAATASSPPRAPEDGKDPLTSIKGSLREMLKTEAASLLSLKVLRFHPNKIVDVIGVATTKPPEPHRAKGGPRGYMLEFLLTDASIAPTHVVTVRIFRAHKEALPMVSPGDVVTLHRFEIKSMKGREFGLHATDDSSWAVFERGAEGAMSRDPQIRGPPMEFSEGEIGYVDRLAEWYGLLDEKAAAKLDKANQKALEA